MKKNLFLSLFSIAMVSITGILVNSFLSRNLSSDDFGYFSTLFLILSLTLLLDGFKPIVTFYVSKEKYDTSNTLFVLSVLLSLVGGVLALFYIDYVTDDISLLDTSLMVAAVIFNILNSFFWGALDGINKVGIAKMIRGGIYSAMYLTMLLLVYLGLGVTYFSFAVFFYLLLLLLVFLYLTPKSLYNSFSFNSNKIREVFKTSKENLAFNMIMSVMYVLDRSVLSRLEGPAKLATYSSQYELATRANLFANNIGHILLPFLAKGRVGNKEYNTWKQILTFSLIMFFVITALVSYFSKDIIFIYLGKDYVEWNDLLKIVMIGLYINCFGIISYSFLRARGDFKTYVYFYGASLLLGCIFVYPLVKNYSFYGAALTYLIVRLGDVGVFYVSLKKKDRMDFIILSFPVFLFVINYFFNELYFIYIIYLLFLILYYKSSLLNLKKKFMKS